MKSAIPYPVIVGLVAAVLGLVLPMLLNPMRDTFVSEESTGLVPAVFDMFQFHVDQPIAQGLVLFLVGVLAVLLADQLKDLF
jgi:hypothetical protein